MSAMLVVFAVNFVAARYIARQRSMLSRQVVEVAESAERSEKATESSSQALAAHETKVAIVEVEMLEGAMTSVRAR